MSRLSLLPAAGVVAAVALVSAASQGPSDGATLDALVDRFVALRRDASGGGVATSAARRAATFRTLRGDLHAIEPAGVTPEQQIDWMALEGHIRLPDGQAFRVRRAGAGGR